MKKATRLITALIISVSFLLSAGPALAGGKHYVDTARDRTMVKIIRAEAKKARLGTADTNALITLGGRESELLRHVPALLQHGPQQSLVGPVLEHAEGN